MSKEPDKEDPKNWQAINFDALHEPFPAEDIEWRIQSAGTKGDKVWAKCLAYIQSRAVMDRLDAVCGPTNWQTRIEHTQGGFIAGIGIKINEEWIWKYDGAQSTDIEAIKGGISGAIKRAAVHWGIGRYLYNLKEFFADISPQGMYYQPKDKKDKYKAFKWNPPKLPVWALPEGHKNVERQPLADGEKVPEDGPDEATDKTIKEVVADINKCTNFKHLKNIYDKYIQIFEGEDKTTLIRAKDVKKGELE